MGLHFSNNKAFLYVTPLPLFRYLDSLFHFRVDVAASERFHTCEFYYDKHIDGLYQDWLSPAYLNPPDERSYPLWLAKAWTEASKNKIVVAYLRWGSWVNPYLCKGDVVNLGEMYILVLGDYTHRIKDNPIPKNIPVIEKIEIDLDVDEGW